MRPRGQPEPQEQGRPKTRDQHVDVVEQRRRRRSCVLGGGELGRPWSPQRHAKDGTGTEAEKQEGMRMGLQGRDRHGVTENDRGKRKDEGPLERWR
jgi:hypothetical protein